MRNLFIVLTVLGVHLVNGQAPIQESFKLDWKIIPAYPNITLFEAGSFYPFNYKDSRVTISRSEQAFMVNFQKKEFGVVSLTDDLKVKWQTPLPGNLYAMTLLNDRIIVVHSASNENRNPDYSIVQGSVLDPKTGKVVFTKNLLDGNPDHFIDVHFFSDPNKKELIIGFRHSNGFFKDKSRSIYGIKRDDYNSTSKYEVITFTDKLEIASKKLLPVKKAAILCQVEMTKSKHFVFAYREGTGMVGLQVISEENQVYYKSFSMDTKSITSDGYYLKTSKLYPNVVFLVAEYENAGKVQTTSLFRIDFSNSEVQNYTRSFTNEYKEHLSSLWTPLPDQKNSKPKSKYWEFLETTDILEIGDKVIYISESVYNNATVNYGSTNNRSYSNHYVNRDIHFAILDQQLKLKNESLFGKQFIYYSMLGNYASTNITDKSVYIVTGTAEGGGTAQPTIIKYSIENEKFEYQKILEKGNRKTMRKISPPSTIWFEKGFAIIFWDGDETILNSSIKTDLQLFSY